MQIDYDKFYLDNGVKCILYKRDEIHSVSIKVHVKVGSLDESETENGISHFIEHLAFDGTKKLKTWQDVNNFNNDISGFTNAYTNTTSTVYYGTYPSHYYDQALDYLAEITINPTHLEDSIQKERTVIIDEKKTYDDTTDYKQYRNMVESRFDKSKQSSYFYEVIGTNDNLNRFSKEEIEAFYNKFYTPKNIEIYIVGNFDQDEIKKSLAKYFGEFKRESSVPEVRNYKTDYPEYSKFTVSSVQKNDIDQIYLAFTFPGFEFTKRSYEDRVKINFFDTMIASSTFQTSLLWAKLREELGIVYDVSAYNYGIFSRAINVIETSFSKEHLETVLTEVYKALKTLKSRNIADDVFKARKKKKIDTQLMELDDPDNILAWILEYERELEVNGKAQSFSDYFEFVKNLKFEDVIELADDALKMDQLNICATSSENAEELNKQITEIWQKLEKLN